MGSQEGRKRLAQGASREEFAVSEGILGSKNDDIQVPLEREVLKPVVEEEEIAPQGIDGVPPPPDPRRADDYGGFRRPESDEDRLIPSPGGIVAQNLLTIRHDQRLVRLFPAIPPGEDTDAAAEAREHPRKFNDERGFSAPPDGQVSHADNRDGEAIGVQKSLPVGGRPGPDREAVPPGRRREERQGAAGGSAGVFPFKNPFDCLSLEQGVRLRRRRIVADGDLPGIPVADKVNHPETIFMNKVLKVIALALFAALLAPGPAASAIHPTTVLKKMEKEWNQVDTLRADVKQVYYDDLGQEDEVYYGRIAVSRPRQLRFDFGRSATAEVAFSSPEAGYEFTVFTETGDYMFEYDREENTLTRDTIEGISALPFLKAVAGLEGFTVERFNQEFYVKSPLPEEEIDSVPVYVLNVKPRSGYEGVRNPFTLWVGTEDALPRKIVLYLPQETVEVELSDYVLNQPIPPQWFHVNVPANAQIIDRTTHF
jgi:outer membrane lipoprotein-sorting protein